MGSSQLACADQLAVLARQADGEPARLVYGADHLFVDRAGEDHFDDVDGGLVGHPQAVDELALDLQPFKHLADLRAAPVDHDRIDADLAQQHDVAGEQYRQIGVAHGMSAELDDEGFARVFTEEGQCLGKCGGLFQPGGTLVLTGRIDGHRCLLLVWWPEPQPS